MSSATENSCRHCDRAIPETARYCPGCGYSTRHVPFPVEPIGVLLILLGVGLIMMARQERED